MANDPDIITIHNVNECINCGRNLDDIEIEYYEKRQVIDAPPKKLIVEEHRAAIKKCPCGFINKANFPEGVNQPVQYGNNLKSEIVYFNQGQLIPVKRTSEIISSLYSHTISTGTVVNASNSCYNAIECVEKEIKE